MVAEIAHISKALVDALAEADAMVRQGSFDSDLAEVVQHARELGELLIEAIERSDEIDPPTRAVASTLAAAVESLEHQVQGRGSMH